jgi:transcriptional regulator with XRE-family HTH domain
MSGLN